MLQKEPGYYPGPTTYEKSQGRQDLNDYMDMRKKAMDGRSENPSNLLEIQNATRMWIESNFDVHGVDYAAKNRSAVEAKLLGLIAFVKQNYPNDICDAEIRASELFIEQAFGMYEEFIKNRPNGQPHPDEDGDFAFVVPSRTSTQNTEYGGETEIVCPITRYAPNEYRGFLGVGLPPFIVDQYNPDNCAGKGYLINASLYPDMIFDMPFEEAKKVAQDNTNDAIELANGLGATVAGLGAIIPALTGFGATIKNKEVITTTGHAGTVYMIDQTIRAAIERGFIKPEAAERLGFLGLGSIGRSASVIITSNFPDSAVNIYDTNDYMLKKGSDNLDDMGRAHKQSVGIKDLLESSDVIVSAVTNPVNLDEIDPDHQMDLTGKLIVDDSQPGMFDRSQVEKRGGTLVWVIAHDTKGVGERTDYDYDTLADSRKDLFGCEAEAASLAYYYNELCYERGLGPVVARRIIEKVAVRERVTVRKARLFGVLFRKYGIIPAPFQVLGEYVDKQPTK